MTFSLLHRRALSLCLAGGLLSACASGEAVSVSPDVLTLGQFRASAVDVPGGRIVDDDVFVADEAELQDAYRAYRASKGATEPEELVGNID